jgi:hypothetical protein
MRYTDSTTDNLLSVCEGVYVLTDAHLCSIYDARSVSYCSVYHYVHITCVVFVLL